MATAGSHTQDFMTAYDEVTQNKLNWILLQFTNNHGPEQLNLFATGDQGLPELKSKVANLDEIFIAFYREEFKGEQSFILINFIPESVSGVRRARALVQSRRLGSLYKRNQATLTIDSLGNLTTAAIHKALADPDSTLFIQMGRSVSQTSAIVTEKALPNPLDMHIRRSVSETPSYSPPPASTGKTGMFSHFLRRKKRPDETLDDSPPPIPPKDKDVYFVQHPEIRNASSQALHTHAIPPRDIPGKIRSSSLSEFAIINKSFSSEEVILNHGDDKHQELVQSPSQNTVIPIHMSSLRGKWTPESSPSRDPAERARRRKEIESQRQIEEEIAIREEAERQARLKHKKQEILKQEIEEEQLRRASLERDLRRAMIERRKKEQQERDEEERKKWELEEKKRADKERRLEESRRLEEWRKEQMRLSEEAVRRAEEERKQEEEERRARIKLVEAKVRSNAKEDSLVTGWVTMQTSESLVWKRRFFKFIGTVVFFYRCPKDLGQILDKVELRGHVRGLREWDEGFEDLEAIPHSFAIEFTDGRGPWAMFADSEEEKDKLLGLLHHAAGLRD